MTKIDELEKKIKNLKDKKVLSSKLKNKSGTNYSIAINISVELITGIVLGVFIGLLIDNYLQTKPIHYHVKGWLTDDHIERLEGLVQ